MALKILGRTIVEASRTAREPEFALTKYGQMACRICKREPPLPGGLCATCKNVSREEVDIIGALTK